MSLTRLFSTTRQARTFPSAVQSLLARHSIDTRPGDFEADANEPIIDHLRRRSLIETVVNEDQLARLAREKALGLYCGADPTARSLHLGNLLPLMVLLHFNLRGHNITALVGGATGTVGDPSGKTSERAQMEQHERLDNVARIQAQFEHFFRSGRRYAASRNRLLGSSHGAVSVRNNFDWWKDMGFLEFLAKYGRFVRVNQMLSRDSVKSRLESEHGIGFNEFSYQLLQAYDFYYLNKNHGDASGREEKSVWCHGAAADDRERRQVRQERRQRRLHRQQPHAVVPAVPVSVQHAGRGRSEAAVQVLAAAGGADRADLQLSPAEPGAAAGPARARRGDVRPPPRRRRGPREPGDQRRSVRGRRRRRRRGSGRVPPTEHDHGGARGRASQRGGSAAQKAARRVEKGDQAAARRRRRVCRQAARPAEPVGRRRRQKPCCRRPAAAHPDGQARPRV
ncbi:hypothetical protein KL930_002547 [Ogataea haglerorum]|uniref:Tyrosine--tRNA ligase n=1 Tax=Ogataea haglerorum TaxID=1937702 RepID=A0ABQ7RIY1_9ASCO|nr:hypothetical protein KL915_002265 [Ogataea haglerorum]KAG7707674.1 hypothetical protein KL914_002495 [Ogataea haglerorum]KAG7709710.1 hypothetical protein KL950_001929 [Ogataea haglerorum]KAG7719789.1 hypothetical protein KL913_001758 [Ogataea haglerorum]KAG7721636.1 hypothetical protein KL949_001368 [Ogataea haglerorum]